MNRQRPSVLDSSLYERSGVLGGGVDTRRPVRVRVNPAEKPTVATAYDTAFKTDIHHLADLNRPGQLTHLSLDYTRTFDLTPLG